MLMSVNLTYCGQHFVMQTNNELCCIPETNTMLYVNYTSIKKINFKIVNKIAQYFFSLGSL